MSSRFLDEHGRILRLGEKLGEGGEGAVYRLADQSSQAIKIYSSPLTAERARKIKILAGFNQTDARRYTAWPSGLVLDERGRARGLLLPAIEQAADVHNLYTPSSRRKRFPDANWRFLAHVGGNVARAFGALHDLGLVIGDVNPGSILVLRDGTVRLIDVDSFQVPVAGQRPLLCTVAVSLFLPPELHGAPLHSVVRTPDHDAFGLAVTLFLLLMLGRHPFAGRFLLAGEMPIERAIAEHRFAFSARASEYDMQRPPNAVGLEILPAEVAALFEVAFAQPVAHRRRPSARQWIQALGNMSAELAQCGRSPTHQYPRSLSRCPWCAFEHSTGVLLFGIPTAPTSHGNDVEYNELVRLIAAVPQPTQVVLPHKSAAATIPASSDARRSAKVSGVSWGCYALGILLLVVGIVVLPRGGLIFMAPGVAILLLGAVTRSRSRAPWVSAYRIARAELEAAEAQLKQANRFSAYAAARAAASQASRDWDELPRLRALKYRQLEENKRQLQLKQFLQSQLIESANIKGIGSGRIAMLSAYGIDTAADIRNSRVQQVPQFGPVLADRLLSWRRVRERAFVYDPSKPLPRESVAQLEKDIYDARQRVIDDLRRTLREMHSASAVEGAAVAAAARRLQAATTAMRQAEADVLAAARRIPT